MKSYYCNGKKDICTEMICSESCQFYDGSGGYYIPVDNNPYWRRIEAIAARQRAKGMKTYGQGIEANPEALHKRIDMALEELIDLAMYLCWVDDKIKELEDESDG